jgi:hypothetical protein
MKAFTQLVAVILKGLECERLVIPNGQRLVCASGFFEFHQNGGLLFQSGPTVVSDPSLARQSHRPMASVNGDRLGPNATVQLSKNQTVEIVTGLGSDQTYVFVGVEDLQLRQTELKYPTRSSLPHGINGHSPTNHVPAFIPSNAHRMLMHRQVKK